MLRDEPTGVDVFTNASLDYEQIRSYEITVAARDNGDPVMSRYTETSNIIICSTYTYNMQ